ncbi:MAG: D-3-phosphoglycerate dehydrogenase [Sorangiineae bacterium NIC37A_2]|jgi:D-3-phosphoglycerate dehydrogenase|nr:MAG: D-3-phosphoglycerate dehydrogenase [Sorangiineae bacterium NIC37A_2]
MSQTSYPKNKIKVLLLENIHESGRALFRADGLDLEVLSGALGEEELRERISDVHIIGIRSKTNITASVLEKADRLLAIGCFCIGTNQVDLEAAKRRGIPVFNAPFSNTRSVAELVISDVVALARHIPDNIRDMHQGVWQKSATGSFEVRGKSLGIVGYGRIGRQVGVLAEAMGMKVSYYDIEQQLPMGNNKPILDLDVLLAESDFVTLHVPETDETKNLMSRERIAKMKKGAYLLNLARGTVVDIPALAEALKSGHLAGAAIDVFPKEPKGNGPGFESELVGLKNVILTPHIGGSTEEAQYNIGLEVAGRLLDFLNAGMTTGAVNFPQIGQPLLPGKHRILNVHKNVPGVLTAINGIVSATKANVAAQVLATDPILGYLVMDLDRELSEEVKEQVKSLDTSIRTRILY